jgi:hypothetical protein
VKVDPEVTVTVEPPERDVIPLAHGHYDPHSGKTYISVAHMEMERRGLL